MNSSFVPSLLGVIKFGTTTVSGTGGTVIIIGKQFEYAVYCVSFGFVVLTHTLYSPGNNSERKADK